VSAWVSSGDSAWAAGDNARARAAYHAAVQRDPDASSRAVYRLATLLLYDNQLDSAITLFRHYVQLEPRDDAGRIAVGRALAWAGRYDDAIAVYDTVLSHTPGDPDAQKGIARVWAWRGDLAQSEAHWTALTQSHPRDAEAWVGLAQVLRWNGEPVAARDAVDHALAVDPANADAHIQQRWLDAELLPTARVDIDPSNDSDHNRATWYAATFGVRPPWNGRLALVAGARTTSFHALDAQSIGLRLRGRWSLDHGVWTLNGEVGGTHLSGEVGGASQSIETPFRWIASGGLHLAPVSWFNGGASVTRAPFDETAALILAGISTTGVNADGSFTLPARFTLDLGGGFTRLTGGTPNDRHNAMASLRYTLSRALSVATTVRGFGYDTAATDGYFSPEFYRLIEGSLRGRVGGDLGWRASGDVGLGTQRVRLRGNTTSRAASRAAFDIGYHFAPGYAVNVTGSIANLPSTSTVSPDGYRWYSVGVGAEILLR